MTITRAQPVQILAQTFQSAIQRRDWAAAREAGRELARHLPDKASIAYNLGLVEKSAGALEAAMEAFERALSLAPDHRNARFELAACLMETGKFEQALSDFELYLEQKPDDTDALLNLGRILTRLDRPQEALPHLERTHRLSPGDGTRIALAAALRDLGRFDEARACLDQLARTPESAALRLKILTQGARGRFPLKTS